MNIVSRSVSLIVVFYTTLINGYSYDRRGTTLNSSEINRHRHKDSRNMHQALNSHPRDNIFRFASNIKEESPTVSHIKGVSFDDLTQDVITVCRCDVTNVCIENERMKKEDELFLRLKTISDDETVVGVKSLIFSQDNFVVKAIQDDRIMNQFTWVLDKNDIWIVRSRLESSFFRPTFRAKPRENITVTGIAVVQELEWPHRRKKLAFQISIPMQPTRLFGFMRKYDPALVLFTISFLGMIVLAFYSLYEFKWLPWWRLRTRDSSFPSHLNKSEAPNAAEITRIFIESNREKFLHRHIANEENGTGSVGGVTSAIDPSDAEEIERILTEANRNQKTPKSSNTKKLGTRSIDGDASAIGPSDAEEIERIFFEAKGGK